MRRQLVLAVAVVCACGTRDAPPDAADATADARLPDADPDTSGMHDGGLHDANDAGGGAGWISVSGSFPAEAQLEIADADLVARTVFPVEGCPDRPGCRRIVQTWPSGICTGGPGMLAPCSPFVTDDAHGAHDGILGTVLIRRMSTLDRAELWAVDDMGRARAGFRSATSPAPSIAIPDLDDHAITLAIAWASGDVPFDVVLVAPYANPLAFTDLGEVNTSTPGGGDFLQRLQLGHEAIAAELTSLYVVRVGLDGSAPVPITDAPASSLGAIAGRTLFFDTFDGYEAHVRVARDGEPSEQLITGPSLNSHRIATDGHDLVWLEFDSDALGNWVDFQVWTSPYAEHPADLAPRLLDTPARAGIHAPIRVGNGYAAVSDGTTGAFFVYRLSDGYRASLVPSAGEIWFSPAYVGPTEIAVAGHLDDARFTTQICFIELASLTFAPPI